MTTQSGLAPRWPQDRASALRGNPCRFGRGFDKPMLPGEVRFRHGQHDKQYLAHGQQRHQLGVHGASRMYEAVDPSLVRPHTSGFGVPDHVVYSSPRKLSTWLRGSVAVPGHAFGQAGRQLHVPVGATQAEQIEHLVNNGGYRAGLLQSTAEHALRKSSSSPSVGGDSRVPPGWVSRLHNPDYRRSSAGRTQMEQIVFLERGGGLRSTELSHAMSNSANDTSNEEAVEQYLKTARVHTAPLFGHRIKAKADHLESPGGPASPPRFPRVRLQQDHWGDYASRVLEGGSSPRAKTPRSETR